MGPHGPVWARMDPYIINYIFVYVTDTLFLHYCISMSLDGCIIT